MSVDDRGGPGTVRARLLLLAAALPAFAACGGQPAASGGALDTALLTVADLPAGFQSAPVPAATPLASDPPACGATIDKLEGAAGAGVEETRATFADGSGLTRIQEILRRYDEDSPQVTPVREAIAQCPSFTLSGPDGTRVDVTAAIVDTSATGFTATLQRHGAGDDVHEVLVVDQVSSTVLVLSYAAPEPPDLGTASRLARTAAGRL